MSDNVWSPAPYAKCISFDDFCNIDTTTLRADPNAIVHVSYDASLTSSNVGKLYITARCKRETQVFEKINHACKRIRCQCRRRRSSYYCVKTRDDADLGRCVDAPGRSGPLLL